MSFKFKPLSDEELDSMNLADPGIYDFTVEKCTPKTSRSGNQMAELYIKFWDVKGKPNMAFDYLVFSEVPLNIRKVSHFSDAVGLKEAYLLGDLPHELAGYSGKVEIGIQEPSAKEGGGVYPKKNIVLDYVKSSAVAASLAQPDAFHDDELPF